MPRQPMILFRTTQEGGLERCCRMCHQWKPIAEFHASQHAPGGYDYRCKPCARHQTKIWREKRKRAYIPPPAETTKLCGSCRVVKSALEFDVDRRTTSGLYAWCKTCSRVRKYKLNLYKDDYREMYEAQQGLCLICGTAQPPPEPLNIDHDHETGVVRGLLCHLCNVGLGAFRDRPDLLESAANYLRANGKN